jgi:ribosome biogenesis GTPase A
MKILVSIVFFLSSFFSAFDVTDDVVAAIKSGKSSELVKFFDEKLTVKILNQEDLLSKAQAEANIKFFFEKHIIKNFTVSQSRTVNNNVQFVSGSLETANGKFRVSILLRRNLISQFRIENDNE